MKIYLRIFLCFIILLSSNQIVNSQSIYQIWPTIDVQGDIFDDFEVKIEYRNKYDNSSKESKQGRIDLGVAYKLKKFKVGLYYREIYNLKKEGRVSEIRPHLDITYKLNDNMKIMVKQMNKLKKQISKLEKKLNG